MSHDALGSSDYDSQWDRLGDFIQHNPGARHRRRMIGRILSNLPERPERIIDLGCGPGFTISAVSVSCPLAELVGIDFSTSAIREARNRMPQHTWIVADATSTTDLEPADVVICTEVIEHVDDPHRFAAQLLNFCREDGHLILTTQSGHVHATERAVGHLRHFSKSDLREILENAGWNVIEVRSWGWPGYWLLKKIANVNPTSTMDKLGNGSYSPLAKAINKLAYVLTRVFSLHNSPLGTQLVVVALRS